MHPSDARRGELAGVDVGDLDQGGVDALLVLPLHHQDGLGGVEVELMEGESEGERGRERGREREREGEVEREREGERER